MTYFGALGKNPQDENAVIEAIRQPWSNGQVEGQILLVSEFTLVADTQKGNRPGFSRGASPAHGKAVYEATISALQAANLPFATGQFGADMQVSLVNDGPVTFQFTL